MNRRQKDFRSISAEIYFTVFIVGLIIPCNGQVNFEEPQVTVDSIFRRMEEVFLAVEDYTVKVKISVKMPGFRMPKKKVKLYFKQPDKLRVKAKGFAVVPKTGLTTSMENLLKGLSNPRVTGIDTVEGNLLWVVEGNPETDSTGRHAWTFMGDESERMLMKVWIDLEKGLIPQVETYIDSVKIMSVQSVYKRFDEEIYLPERTDIQFHIKGEFLEAFREGNRDNFGPRSEQAEFPSTEEFVGSIKMEFNKYKINQGLKDKIFEKTIFQNQGKR